MADLGIGEIAAIAAAGVAAVGSIASGVAQSNAAKYNAEVEQQRAQEAEQQAEAQAAIDKQNTARKMGQAEAAYGASGVDPNSGSPLNVMSDLATQGELTRQLTLYQGKIGAIADLQQGALDKLQGQNALTSGIVGAGSTLLTAGARLATQSATSSLVPTSFSPVASPNLSVQPTMQLHF
ncbi:MAG TPA: hypothetical protein VKZ79_07650 [Alphaproteobacteria bacterium]|nr:hypothetical protein [Alphaproteobacteria bacterium]